MFRYALYRALNRVLVGIEVLKGTLVIQFYRQVFNLAIGRSNTFYGTPIISCIPGSHIRLGNDCRVRSTSTGNAICVNHPAIFRTPSPNASTDIGNGLTMSGGAICSIDRVVIGDNVMIGANCRISDSDLHPINRGIGEQNREVIGEPIIIDSNAWIGVNCFIHKGSKIGSGSIVGAHSVVTGEIPANCIAAGVPARIIGMLNEEK